MRKTNDRTKNTRPRAKRPAWLAFVIVFAMTGMLFVSINYRSFSAMNGSISENEQLTTKIESLTDENLQLQDEIHSLKTDPNVIEREAKRLGIPIRVTDAKATVSVPTK